jgi:hypothetical protein
MATLGKMLTMAAVASLACAGCGKLAGLDTPATPLAQIHVVTGDLAPPDAGASDEQPPNLRVALVWGTQSLPEPFCVAQPESVVPALVTDGWQDPSVAAVVTEGCPDNFRFVPDRDGADIAITAGVPATITLVNLPGADVMVGGITSRVAYASLIVYDDRNGNSTLDFHHPPQHQRHGQQDVTDVVDDAGPPATRDFVYGASFISMTMPDQRVAYLEGVFDPSVAFYPRNGCDPPPAGFSILSAGGFPPPDYNQTDVLAQALQPGNFPKEDQDTCGVANLDEVVTIPLLPVLQPPVSLPELICTVNDTGGGTFYRKPPATAPDLDNLKWACVGFPQLPPDDAGVSSGIQLVVASYPQSEPCQYINHYTLRGCYDDPNCSTPDWDVTATPPAWWPCPTTP